MGGVTTHGIRYPDGASKAKNLGPELKTMAEDIDYYIGSYLQPTGPIRQIVIGIAEEIVPGLVEEYLDDSPRIPKVEDNGWAFAWADQNGKVALGIRESGAVSAPVMNGVRTTYDDSEYAVAWTDRYGRVAFGIKESGEVYDPRNTTETTISRGPEPAYSSRHAVWDPRLASYNLHPRNMSRWASALARGDAHLMTLGDSRTRGALATGTSNPKHVTNWPGRLAALLGAAGTGIVPFFDETFNNPATDPRWSWGTGVTSRTTYGGARRQWGPQGVACGILDNSSGNGWVEFAPGVPVSGFTVWLAADSTSTGLATIKIDGVTVGTVSLAPVASGGTLARAAGYGPNQIVVTVPVSAGTHTLRIEGATGELTNFIAAEGSASGLRVSNMARSATNVDDWNHDTGDGRGGAPWHIDAALADLMILMPITNDRNDNPSAYKAQIETLLERQLAIGDALMILPCAPNFSATEIGGSLTNWHALCEAMFTLADELDVPLIDNTWAWRGFAEADGLDLFADNIHENDAGSRRIAHPVAHALEGI